MKFLLLILLISAPMVLLSQTFFRTGAATDLQTEPLSGILLAGGGTDNDDGMKWLTDRAMGGDVVVLRASGSDGYNDYIYYELGSKVNSVTTIVISSAEQANKPEVCQAVEKAELIFIAGGDQKNYYNYWKGTCLLDALNRHVNEKAAPIGGTSAGLAVLGEVVYTAQNGSVTSAQALGNPYNTDITLAKDFLKVPFLENLVTDTHYAERNRQGRHMAFMARMIQDWQMEAKGIGVDEFTAVAVDDNGIARVFGQPFYDDFAYFLKAISEPEICQSGSPLTWSNDSRAVIVYKVKGNFQGSRTFDLNNWEQGAGGTWEYWYVNNGQLHILDATSSDHQIADNENDMFSVFPNPAVDNVTIERLPVEGISSWQLLDIKGAIVKSKALPEFNTFNVDISDVNPGVYFLRIKAGNNTFFKRIIKN